VSVQAGPKPNATSPAKGATYRPFPRTLAPLARTTFGAPLRRPYNTQPFVPPGSR
jgi:hypothetical protein